MYTFRPRPYQVQRSKAFHCPPLAGVLGLYWFLDIVFFVVRCRIICVLSGGVLSMAGKDTFCARSLQNVPSGRSVSSQALCECVWCVRVWREGVCV